MKNAWMLSGCLILAVSAFSQVLQVATKAMPAVVYSRLLHQPERPTGFRYASTYSKPHAAFAVVMDEDSRHIVLKNMLWGGLAGLGLGASISLAGGRDNRLKFQDVVIVSAVGAAGGLVVGLVTGLVKKAKQKRKV
jgi:hypothetical protein